MYEVFKPGCDLESPSKLTTRLDYVDEILSCGKHGEKSRFCDAVFSPLSEPVDLLVTL